jgi:hypothetical protein
MDHKQLNELTKHATARRGLVGAGIGGALGATAGAIYGGFRKKEEDESRLEAILKGLAGGGLFGAGAGGSIGIVTSPDRSVTSTEWSPYNDMRSVPFHSNSRLSDNPTQEELQNWVGQGLQYTFWDKLFGKDKFGLKMTDVGDKRFSAGALRRFRRMFDPQYEAIPGENRMVSLMANTGGGNEHSPPRRALDDFISTVLNSEAGNRPIPGPNWTQLIQSFRRAASYYDRVSNPSGYANSGKPKPSGV